MTTTNTEPTPWHQTNWAKGTLWIVSVITVSLLLVRFFREPQTKLTATYRQASFAVPVAIQSSGKADSVEIASSRLVNQLYEALYERSTEKERQSLDSLHLSETFQPSIYSGVLHGFLVGRDRIYALHIKNEGDVTLGQIQVLPGSKAFYEYTDSEGKIQSGEVVGKFSIGELAPTESRNIYLWSNALPDLYGLTVVYPGGKVQAEKPTEVTGFLAWVVEHLTEILFCLIFLMPIALLYGFTLGNQRRKTAEATEAEKLQQSKEEAEKEVTQQTNEMLGVKQSPPVS